MKVLAFLQNQWLDDPEKALAMIERTPAVRPRLIKYALFQSHTGNRLKQVFGDGCMEWEWDNASPQIGSHSRASFPADPKHIRAVLDKHKPDVVLAFGKVAAKALKDVSDKFELIVGPHPAARQDDVMGKLKKMAEALNDYEDSGLTEVNSF